ncbi:M1 family metallopeptidase [Kribbella sp. NPDC058245]|uniref:M1 family metallopeptidase n=1 Tax=Kribbella sp. NPDC058245 TaxID=3346399 RepID=UPI0036F03BB4
MQRTVRRIGVTAAVASLALLSTAAISTASTAGTGTPGAPGVGDTVFPNLGNGGYQAEHYLIEMKYDAATKLIDATMTMDARSTQHLTTFDLDSYGLDIRTVEVDGEPAQYQQDGHELVITPAGELSSTFTVKVHYQADPRLLKPPLGGFVATPDGFSTAPQPDVAHTVFPGNDHPSDKASYTFKVTAPAGTIGVANGSKTGEEPNADGSTTYTYQSREPLPTELVQISVGDFDVIDRGTTPGGARLRDVVPKARVADLEPALQLTKGQLGWVEERLGPYPFEAYGLLPANSDASDAFDFTGLETQTLTLYKPNYLKRPENQIGTHMVHEVTHSWFGNSVSPADWGSLWLNEGNANYYSFLYQYERGWTDTHGKTTMLDRMKETYGNGDIWRAKSGPVAKPNAAHLFDDIRYTGGTLTLFALSEKIGLEKFNQIQLAYLRTFKNRSATTEDYIALATQVSGDPTVRPFLEDWLYGTKEPPMPNHPDWTITPPTAKALRTIDVQRDRYDG